MTDGDVIKKTLCVDFDGVVHAYTSGWKGADVVADDPVPGAIEWLARAVERFDVCIYSSRSSQTYGLIAMREWLAKHGGEALVKRLRFPSTKPAAFLTIDDRAICFDGTWPELDAIDGFTPWNKRGAK